MADVEENAIIVNALQRHATIVVQKSLAEGFGLTVSEAMFKRRLSPHTLTNAELHELAPDIMLGLRLFVAEKRLPELMVSLAELLEEHAP